MVQGSPNRPKAELRAGEAPASGLEFRIHAVGCGKPEVRGWFAEPEGLSRNWINCPETGLTVRKADSGVVRGSSNRLKAELRAGGRPAQGWEFRF